MVKMKEMKAREGEDEHEDLNMGKKTEIMMKMKIMKQTTESKKKKMNEKDEEDESQERKTDPLLHRPQAKGRMNRKPSHPFILPRE